MLNKKMIIKHVMVVFMVAAGTVQSFPGYKDAISFIEKNYKEPFQKLYAYPSEKQLFFKSFERKNEPFTTELPSISVVAFRFTLHSLLAKNTEPGEMKFFPVNCKRAFSKRALAPFCKGIVNDKGQKEMFALGVQSAAGVTQDKEKKEKGLKEALLKYR
jgi:hypothetical protein